MWYEITRCWTFSKVRRSVKTQADKMNNSKMGKVVGQLLSQQNFKREKENTVATFGMHNTK